MMLTWQESSGNGASLDKMLAALENIGGSTTAIRQDLEKVNLNFSFIILWLWYNVTSADFGKWDLGIE